MHGHSLTWQPTEVHGAYTPVSCTQPSRQPIRPGAVITLGQATPQAQGDHDRQTVGIPWLRASLANRRRNLTQKKPNNFPLSITQNLASAGRWSFLKYGAN